MRRSKTVTDEAARVEFVPSDTAQPLPLAEMLPNPGPLEVDLGCGDGSFIAALAAMHPERNYLGVERLLGRVRTACRKIAAQRLTNVRILRVDIAEAAATLIPPASVAVCHVMFPDPWPKRRHHVRRTVTAELVRAISRILVPGGLLRLTTDDQPYFVQMQEAVAAVRAFEIADEESAPLLPRSEFESRFIDAGLPIHRLVLRNVSPSR